MLYLPAAQPVQKSVKALCTLRVCDASRLYSGIYSCRTLPKYVCWPVEANVLKGIDVLYLTPASAAVRSTALALFEIEQCTGDEQGLLALAAALTAALQPHECIPCYLVVPTGLEQPVQALLQQHASLFAAGTRLRLLRLLPEAALQQLLESSRDEQGLLRPALRIDDSPQTVSEMLEQRSCFPAHLLCSD
jgi:hypothetical protein